MKKTSLILTLLIASLNASALKLPLPNADDDVAGPLNSTMTTPKQSFAGIARQHDLGFFELLEANPQINPDKLPPNTEVIIPTQFVLPHLPRKDIIINLGTMRLFYFPKGKDYFYTYPVGIGKKDWSTPLGTLTITQKIKNPVWLVPNSIYEYRLKQGDPVSHVIQSGPNNPLGYYAMRLSKPTYLIHGTNDPRSVGVRSSAGCVHLYPEDIEALFNMVKPGTQVVIINQPYLAGWHNKKLFIEAHLPLEEQREQLSNVSADVVALTNGITDDNSNLNWSRAKEVVRDHTGVPTPIN